MNILPEPPSHEHVFVQYQKGAKPRCFRCFFWEEKQKRGVRIPATAEATRKRTRDNYRRGRGRL
jgi:hypothetical protein